VTGRVSWFWCGQRLFDDPGYEWSGWLAQQWESLGRPAAAVPAAPGPEPALGGGAWHKRGHSPGGYPRRLRVECALLLDHLVRQDQERRGECDPECLRRLHVEDQVELRRLLHRQVGGLGTLQNLVHIRRPTPPPVRRARRIAEE